VEILWLSLASTVGWFISTLVGGGSPLILIPTIGLFLGTNAVAPVITTGMLFGNGQRIGMYWRHINWKLMWWYLPGAVVGSIGGAFIFSRTEIEWLSLLLGLFLIISVLGYGAGQQKPSFPVKAWYFLPAGFLYSFLSGLIGSSGPLLNPFYLNYGLVKEELIATKSSHVMVVHVVKMAAYAVFGVFTGSYLLYGLLIGVAALPGNWLGQIILERMSEQRFRQFVMTFVLISGTLMIWQQRQVFGVG
jgi:uncharacterized membrane protein YfcA